MAIGAFLFQWVLVSLSGVMAPGPVTAATVAAGTRRRHAGAWITLGHMLVELPLIVLVVLGAETFKASGFRIGIGLAGGLILIWLAAMTLRGLRPGAEASEAPSAGRGPFWTGIAMTGGNPYFILWWATVGLALASRAVEFGLAVFIVFVLVHWLCDLLWLEVLSGASYRGVAWLGKTAEKGLTLACGLAMGAFGVWFVVDAVREMAG